LIRPAPPNEGWPGFCFGLPSAGRWEITEACGPADRWRHSRTRSRPRAVQDTRQISPAIRGRDCHPTPPSGDILSPVLEVPRVSPKPAPRKIHEPQRVNPRMFASAEQSAGRAATTHYSFVPPCPILGKTGYQQINAAHCALLDDHWRACGPSCQAPSYTRRQRKGCTSPARIRRNSLLFADKFAVMASRAAAIRGLDAAVAATSRPRSGLRNGRAHE